MAVLVRFVLFVHLGQGCRFEHVDDEYRVMGRQRASAFGDDVGVGYAVLVGTVHECVYAIVDILLDRVVHRAFAARRACAVVVYSQSAATVYEVNVIPHLVQLYVEVRCFSQGGLYASYLRYLASDVEVYQAQAVVHAFLVEQFERFEQLAACESELAGVSSALFPFAAAACRQLDAYSEIGLHVELLCLAGNDFKFVELLHDDEYALAHLVCEQGQFYVALVLVAVAYYERVALALDGYHGVQFRLRAGFEAEIEFAAMRYYFFHHRLHLVHLDGVYYEVLGLVVICLGRFLEATACLLDAVVEDVGKAQQHRACDVS